MLGAWGSGLQQFSKECGKTSPDTKALDTSTQYLTAEQLSNTSGPSFKYLNNKFSPAVIGETQEIESCWHPVLGQGLHWSFPLPSPSLFSLLSSPLWFYLPRVNLDSNNNHHCQKPAKKFQSSLIRTLLEAKAKSSGPLRMGLGGPVSWTKGW